jgi:hypothetical protein
VIPQHRLFDILHQSGCRLLECREDSFIKVTATSFIGAMPCRGDCADLVQQGETGTYMALAIAFILATKRVPTSCGS